MYYSPNENPLSHATNGRCLRKQRNIKQGSFLWEAQFIKFISKFRTVPAVSALESGLQEY